MLLARLDHHAMWLFQQITKLNCLGETTRAGKDLRMSSDANHATQNLRSNAVTRNASTTFCSQLRHST
jgi:hypothetical protein